MGVVLLMRLLVGLGPGFEVRGLHVRGCHLRCRLALRPRCAGVARGGRRRPGRVGPAVSGVDIAASRRVASRGCAGRRRLWVAGRLLRPLLLRPTGLRLALHSKRPRGCTSAKLFGARGCACALPDSQSCACPMCRAHGRA